MIFFFAANVLSFLRPDREEASVMPLINAGFNRVRNGVYDFILLLPVCIHNILFKYIYLHVG